MQLRFDPPMCRRRVRRALMSFKSGVGVSKFPTCAGKLRPRLSRVRITFGQALRNTSDRLIAWIPGGEKSLTQYREKRHHVARNCCFALQFVGLGHPISSEVSVLQPVEPVFHLKDIIIFQNKLKEGLRAFVNTPPSRRGNTSWKTCAMTS